MKRRVNLLQSTTRMPIHAYLKSKEEEKSPCAHSVLSNLGSIMRSRNFRRASAAVAFGLLSVAVGCGGGSMGTGVLPPKTLQDSPIEKSSIPRIPSWLRAKPGACLMRYGGAEIPIEVETEVGAAAPLTQRADRCSFFIPTQAQLITVRSTWLENEQDVSYRLEKVLCHSGRRQTLRDELASIEFLSFAIRTAAQSQDSMLALTIRRADGQSISVVFVTDQAIQCKEIV